ncbi:ATP-binding protein [Vibrio natriegens]
MSCVFWATRYRENTDGCIAWQVYWQRRVSGGFVDGGFKVHRGNRKNLSRVFDAASYKEWILFFDEGDALFGKRTEASSSNDRHANQLTGYLLQKIEDFPGTVIVATNLKSNMDEAFTRRFQNMVHFTIPGPEERLQLWKNAFHNVCDLADDVDLNSISSDYQMAGGQIINVLRQCALTAIRRNERKVYQQDIISGIRNEFRKDNKLV